MLYAYIYHMFVPSESCQVTFQKVYVKMQMHALLR